MEVQTLEGLQRQVDLKLSVEQVEAEVKKELQQIARRAKIQGFRPGKAPLSIVARQHGAGVRYEVVERHVGEAFAELVRDTDLRVAGMPSIAPKEGEAPEGELHFVATFEVYPTIELPDFEALAIEQAVCEIGEEELASTIEILREQRATFEAQEDKAAADGDRLTVNFEGKIDGEVFEGGVAEDFEFVLGKGMMLPEFEAAAQGLKAGESKTFELTFPEDYQGQEVAGKTAEFTITVNQVAEAKLPEVDADFAKSLGQEDGDVSKLREEILSNIQREGKQRLLQRTKNSVMDALLAAVDFDVPSALIQREIGERIERLRQEFAMQGMQDFDFSQIPTESFKPEAERRVRLGLLVAEIIEKNELEATPEQVRARIEEFAQNYEEPEQVIAFYLSDEAQRAGLESLVLEDNMVDLILSKAKVTQTEVPFKELMGQA